MKYLLITAAPLLLLASCARPNQPSRPPQSEPISEATAPTDTVATAAPVLDSITVSRPPTALEKLLGRTPTPYTVAVTPARIGKKSTVNVYYGPATVTTSTVGKKSTAAIGAGATATAIGKAKGPTAIGDSAAATDNTKQGQRGGAVASGAGATATATTSKGLSWWLLLVPVVGYAAYKINQRLTIF